MKMQTYKKDIEMIKSHKYDNGYDLWATSDKKLLKNAPFSTLESTLYLLEVGVSKDDSDLQGVAELIFSVWKTDGRFKTAPSGGYYPCHTAFAFKTLNYLGYSNDIRMQKTLQYFIDTQEEDGGWKCLKYSFGRGEETYYSTPNTTLLVIDSMRFITFFGKDKIVNRAIDFLLQHWTIKKPISPCHYGIGTLFMQIEYPFRGYNLFYFVYILSFYEHAQVDKRFLQAYQELEAKTVNGEIVVERVVPKLAKLDFCRKGQPSALATIRFNEIKNNIFIL